MRISVIINPQAGQMKLDLVKRKIQEALFRCDLKFHLCEDLDALCSFTKKELTRKTEAFLICGGDGTVNATLQCLLRHKQDQKELPPICLVSSGTANDLAQEMDISHRVDQAARLLLEGRVKKIDLIEVESNATKKYMLTNGGIGIPALAAEEANVIRQTLRKFIKSSDHNRAAQKVGQWTDQLMKKSGTLIYSASVLKTIKDWKADDWQLEIQVPGQKSFLTTAPFLLVNNQSRVGQKFLTAPYTAHDDGLVNLLVVESSSKISQLEKLARVYLGKLRESSEVKSMEQSEFRIRTRSKTKKLTFFGDGEILFKNVEEVKIRCFKRNIGIMVKD